MLGQLARAMVLAPSLADRAAVEMCYARHDDTTLPLDPEIRNASSRTITWL